MYFKDLSLGPIGLEGFSWLDFASMWFISGAFLTQRSSHVVNSSGSVVGEGFLAQPASHQPSSSSRGSAPRPHVCVKLLPFLFGGWGGCSGSQWLLRPFTEHSETPPFLLF